MNTPNLGLSTEYPGMGLNAAAKIAENFRKVDAALDGSGGGGGTTPTADDVLMTGYVAPEGGIVEATDTVNEAIAKLDEALAQANGLISAQNTVIAGLTGRIEALEQA